MIKIQKDELFDLYFVKNMTKKQISQYYNCSEKVIDNRFKLWKWKFRSPGLMAAAWMKNNSKLLGKIESIKKLYLEDKKTCKEIGNLYNVGESSIARFLKKNKVQLRQLSDAQIHSVKIEKNIIYDLYVNKKQSCDKISKMYKCNEETIRKHLINFQIERRESFKFTKDSTSPANGARYILKHGSDKEKDSIKEKISLSHRKHFENDIDQNIIGRHLIRLSKIKKGNKVLLKCLNDGFEWLMSVNHIVSGRGCPICKHKNEKETFVCLQNILNSTKIKHSYKLTTHTWMEKERNIYVDFYFEFKNKRIVVEYQGEQHYRPVCFNGIDKIVACENFKRQNIRDNIVRKFCKENNIILIEIDGRKYNIYKKNIKDFIETMLGEIT